jgi:hypothetical protein
MEEKQNKNAVQKGTDVIMCLIFYLYRYLNQWKLQRAKSVEYE